MLNFNLSTKIEITAVLKKTNAKFWKDIKEGDKMILSYEMKECFSFERDYRPVIKITMGNIVYEDSIGRILKNMKNFEIIELGG